MARGVTRSGGSSAERTIVFVPTFVVVTMCLIALTFIFVLHHPCPRAIVT